MNKTTLPREIANAIESFRSDGWSTWRIVRVAGSNESLGVTSRLGALRNFVQDTHGNADILLQALVNGYEVERTPEEIAEEKRQAARVNIANRYADLRKGENHSRWARGNADGIQYTLDSLGIEIEGVNA